MRRTKENDAVDLSDHICELIISFADNIGLLNHQAAHGMHNEDYWMSTNRNIVLFILMLIRSSLK